MSERERIATPKYIEGYNRACKEASRRITQLEAQLAEAQREIGQLHIEAKMQESKYREYTKHKEEEEQKLRKSKDKYQEVAILLAAEKVGLDKTPGHIFKLINQDKGGTNDS